MNNLCCVADVVDLFVEIRPGFNGGLPAASVVFFSHFGTRLAALQLQETIVRVRLGVRTANRVEFHVADAVAAGETARKQHTKKNISNQVFRWIK